MMGIFIDTGIFVAARNKSDKNHDKAVDIIKKIQNKEFGDCYSSDYVFDEAIILMGTRTKSFRAMRDIGDFILEMPNLMLQYTDSKIFQSAWKIHEKYDDRLLSFTDATIIAWCKSLKIKYIATIDSHFDGILISI